MSNRTGNAQVNLSPRRVGGDPELADAAYRDAEHFTICVLAFLGQLSLSGVRKRSPKAVGQVCLVPT